MTIYIGTPTTRPFDTAYVRSLFATHLQRQAVFDVVEGQAIDVGRNAICRRFLDHPVHAEWLLMHDSDATWHPEAVERLISRNLPMVSAVIFQRGLPPRPTAGPLYGRGVAGEYLYDFGKTIEQIVKRVEAEGIDLKTPNELVLEPTPDDLYPVDGVGMHFCLIRRDVIEAIPYPWFECKGANAGEDFDFCRKVRAAGYPIYLDLSVYTGHIVGPGFNFGLREMLAFREHTPHFKETGRWRVPA